MLSPLAALIARALASALMGGPFAVVAFAPGFALLAVVPFTLLIEELTLLAFGLVTADEVVVMVVLVDETILPRGVAAADLV